MAGVAICKRDLYNCGRLFPFKIHSGIMSPETWAALRLRLVASNCLASEFQAEASTLVSCVEYMSHDKAL